LSIENAGGQTQDSVQVALVHQVGAYQFPSVALEQHIIGHYHGSTATGLEAAVDVLQKAELLITGGEGEVGARGEPTALLITERRVGEDQRCLSAPFQN
jgi:hypothetical protein